MERSQSKPGPVTESKQSDGKIAVFSYWRVNSCRGTHVDLGKIHRHETSFSKGRFSIEKYNVAAAAAAKSLQLDTFNEKRVIKLINNL